MSDQKPPKFSRDQFPTVNLDFGGARKKTWDELAQAVKELSAENKVMLAALQCIQADPTDRTAVKRACWEALDFVSTLQNPGQDPNMDHAAEKEALADYENEENPAQSGQSLVCCYDHASSIERATQMILCSECGNKRCPKATNHNRDCTDSNNPGQRGSRY